MTSSNGNIFRVTGPLCGNSPVNGEFPAQRPVTRSFHLSLTISLTIVYSSIYSDADQRKHQSYASLAFVWVIHGDPVNSPHEWPVTRKTFPFDDVVMVAKEIHKSLEVSLIKIIMPTGSFDVFKL